MLTGLLRRAAAVTTTALVLACLAQVPAVAGGGPPGNGGFGFAQCGQSSSPSCSVTAGTPGSGSGTAAPGRASGGHGHATTAGGAAPPVRNLLIGAGGLPQPTALAQVAVRYLRLPSPVISSSPGPADLQLTRLPVWLWVPPAEWQPESQTAQVPGESVTATATPVSTAWKMGDGGTVTCHGSGTPYDGGNPAAPSPTCGYTYVHSSAGQPGGVFTVTVTITWDITWTATGGAGGALAPLHTVAQAEFRVAESHALDTSSGG